MIDDKYRPWVQGSFDNDFVELLTTPIKGERRMTLEIAVMHIERAIDLVRYISDGNNPFDKFALVDIESLETVLKELKKRKEE